MMSKHTVHVFSMIPNMAELLAKKIPNINIKSVKMKEDISEKYGKVVTSEELAQLHDSKIILADGNLIAQIYTDLKHVEWVQCTWAGIETIARVVRESGIKPTFTMTRLGCSPFSQLMAEYTIGWILNHERGWLDSREYQKQAIWAHKDNIATYRSLRDVTVGVLGLGLLGSEVVRALKFFNCKVLGLGRSERRPEGLQLDRYFNTSELPVLLKDCDYIVNILPSTPDTKNILGGDTLKFAEKKAVLINIGRADAITERDLLKALDNNWISAAILDVFDKEPLAASSPLWAHPKIIVTPHAAGVSRAEDVTDAFSANFDRYLKGIPLELTVDWDKGY